MNIYKDYLIISGKKNITRETYDVKSDILNNIVKKNRHRRNIYKSVNKYKNSVHRDNIIFKWIYVDFDENPYENCVKFVNYLYDNNINFCIRFSGRGFHVFIKTKVTNYVNLSSKIRQYVNTIIKKTDSLSDNKVLGDLNRVSRVKNTINTKTNLYCIPISYDELINLSFDKIKEMARYPRFVKDFFHHGDVVDIDLIQLKTISTPKTENFIYEKPHTINSYGKVYIKLPPCLDSLIKNKDLNYRERFLIIIYLRDYGFSISETETFLKNILSEEKYNHCLYEENQIYYLYDKDYILFPSCEALNSENLCKKCGGNSLYM